MTLLFTFGAKPAHAATVTWDGGSSGSWNTSTNWSNDIVPTSSDDVTIDNAAVTTSLTLTNNITSGGSIIINNAGTLTQNNKVQQTITKNHIMKLV